MINRAETYCEELSGIEPIGLGWVKIAGGPLCKQLKALAQKLASAGLPLIESLNENCFRLAVHPDHCFLSDHVFSFSVDDGCITLIRQSLDTPLGRFESQKNNIIASKNLVLDVTRIATNDTNRRFSDEDLP